MANKDLIGKKFGRLTVVSYSGYLKRWRCSVWKCICECGDKTYVSTGALNSGHTQSCGCYQKDRHEEATVIHGHLRRGRRSPEAICYYNAKSRCTNPNNPRFPHYGGRGIKFLLPPLAEFYRILGPRPDGMSLDRIDNNGHYKIGNVRWATRSTQIKNRSPRWWNTRQPKNSDSSGAISSAVD